MQDIFLPDSSSNGKIYKISKLLNKDVNFSNFSEQNVWLWSSFLNFFYNKLTKKLPVLMFFIKSICKLYRKESSLVGIDHRDSYAQMKVLANREDINPYKELSVLNQLYDDFKMCSYGFQYFVLTAIVPIDRYFDLICVFQPSRF